MGASSANTNQNKAASQPTRPSDGNTSVRFVGRQAVIRQITAGEPTKDEQKTSVQISSRRSLAPSLRKRKQIAPPRIELLSEEGGAEEEESDETNKRQRKRVSIKQERQRAPERDESLSLDRREEKPNSAPGLSGLGSLFSTKPVIPPQAQGVNRSMSPDTSHSPPAPKRNRKKSFCKDLLFAQSDTMSN